MAVNTIGYTQPPQWNYQIPQLPQPTPGTPVSTQPAAVPSPPASAVTDPNSAQNVMPLQPVTTQNYRQAMAAPKATVPDQWRQTPGQTPGQTGPIYNMYDPATYANATTFEPVNRYLASWYMPQQQMAQNAFQWGGEFNEAQRRWDIGSTQQNQLNQYGMSLQSQQQVMAEWEARQAAAQWAEQFGWTQETDLWSRGLAEDELAQRIQLRQMQDAAALQQANVMAYGRAEKPNARYMRNWG